jgi:DNA-binding Lrp family transcriptional regulator/YHS domain-containing protein
MFLALDLKDLEIIKLLQEDARIPILDISKRLGMSRPSIKGRIEKLQKEGIIRGFTVVVDRNAVLNHIMLLIAMKIEDPAAFEKLKKMDEFLEIYETMGGRNAVGKAMVSDMPELQELMKKLKGLGIKEVDSSIVLNTVKEEFEADIGPDIGISLNCDYCGKEVVGNAYKFKIHNKEYYMCCPICLKAFKKKKSYAKEKEDHC